MIPSGPHLHTGEEERTKKNRNKTKMEKQSRNKQFSRTGKFLGGKGKNENYFFV